MPRKRVDGALRVRPGDLDTRAGAWASICAIACVCGSIGMHSANAAPTPPPDAHCLPIAGALPLANAGTLTMSVNATLPPTQYVDASGALAGMNIDLGNEIARRLCLHPAYVNVAFEAQIPGLQNRRWDMIDTGLFFTASRTRSMQLIPYSIGTLAVITGLGNPHKISSISNLSGKAVGVELGGLEEQKLHEMSAEVQKDHGAPIDMRVFNNYGDAFEALAAAQIDAVFAATDVGKYYARRGRFEIAIDQLSPQSPAAFATSDPKIAAAVVTALSAMSADGTYQHIIAQYGLTTIDKWQAYPGHIQYFYKP